MIILYSKDGLTPKAEIHQFNYDGVFMQEASVTTTIKSSTPIDFEIGDYVMYRNEKFILNYIPAKEKQASAGSHGDAFIYENIKFNFEADDLNRVDFLDVVLEDNNIHFTSQPRVSFFAASVQDLVDRIQANLDRVYTGTQAFTLIVSPDVVTPNRNISVEKIKCWEALGLVNSEFGANFICRGRTITIGTAGMAVGKVFGYGKGNGLYDIQQVTNSDALIITRLRAFGSTRNLPNRYYNKLKDDTGNPLISESAYIPNLMLPAFPYDINDPSLVYIDSDNKDRYGIREGSVYFDDESSDIGEIYPSIEGMTAEQLSAAGITVSLPSGDNGKIDEVLGAINPTDDGNIPDEGTGSIPAQFTIILKDLGFDLAEKDENGKYKYATSDTMQISMKSGMCVARTFDVVENGITKDTSLGYTRFIVVCNRFTDTSVNMAYPNSTYQIASGDRFVILGISMPEAYVKAAAQRLLVAAQNYLSQNDETKYTYIPKIDENFMARNPELHDTLKEGDILNFSDTDLNIEASVIIQTLRISEGDKIIPTYEVTLSNDQIVGTLQRMQNNINSLMSNGTGITLDQVKTLINSWGSSLFLSKQFNDIANGLITFVRGLDVGSYAAGAFGSGGTFRMNQQGQSVVEVDKLYVRMQAIFRELIIEKLSHIGGSLVLSPARMQCNKVDEFTDYYRCYFDTGDNGEVVQEFVVGDQARCQVFNGSGLKYYWRLVVGIGTDYIDLSKTDYDGDGIPAPDDDIVQLGNRDNIERQNAQILSSFGEDAPSYKQYQGINSYSLADKQKTVISPSGNEFDGKVTIKAGSLGWENLVGLPDEFNDLSTGTVNLLRNTGFTGDFKSRELTPDTMLTPDTPMFSDNLKYWDGTGTVNADTDSKSGFSVTLTDTYLNQVTPILPQDENYIISFRAKGESIRVSIAGFVQTVYLTSEYQRYILKFSSLGGTDFQVSGRCTFCELQLERGKIPSDWTASPLDNNRAFEQFESIRYMTDAVKNGSTSILGGLILTTMMQVGNYLNGALEKITAGISGIYNTDDDVAFWSGGTLEQAIRRVVNPSLLTNIANFVVTHGGRLIANEAIIRGTIYATDGEFSGKIIANSGTIGGFNIESDRLTSQALDTEGNPNILLNGLAGTADITGRIQSNANGNKIIIDPADQSIKMIDDEDNILGQWLFYDTSELGDKLSGLYLKGVTSTGMTTSRVTLTGTSISVTSGEAPNTNAITIFPNSFSLKHENGNEFNISFNSNGKLLVRMIGIPEDYSGLPSNTIYKTSDNTLKIT